MNYILCWAVDKKYLEKEGKETAYIQTEKSTQHQFKDIHKVYFIHLFLLEGNIGSGDKGVHNRKWLTCVSFSINTPTLSGGRYDRKVKEYLDMKNDLLQV